MADGDGELLRRALRSSLMFIFEVQNVMRSRPRLAAPLSPWGGRDCGSRGEGMGSEVPRNEPIAERMCVVRPSGRVPLCSRTKYQSRQSSQYKLHHSPDPLSRAARAPRFNVYLPTASRSQLITIRRWTAVRACFCTSGSECLRIDITCGGRRGA